MASATLSIKTTTIFLILTVIPLDVMTGEVKGEARMERFELPCYSATRDDETIIKFWRREYQHAWKFVGVVSIGWMD